MEQDDNIEKKEDNIAKNEDSMIDEADKEELQKLK